MKTNPIKQTNFKGYDARPLKGFIMNSNNNGIGTEMFNIGQKEGFKIYSSTQHACKEWLLPADNKVIGIWAQDLWTVLKDSILFKYLNDSTNHVLSCFNLKSNSYQEKLRTSKECVASVKNVLNKEIDIENYLDKHFMDHSEEILIEKAEELKFFHQLMLDTLAKKHISGGNIFIMKGNSGEEALVGENEMQEFSPEEIMELYSVNKITIIPQMDYHLDLFLRPLDNQRVLLTDDNMTLKVLENAKIKLKEYINNNKKTVDYRIIDSYNDIYRMHESFKWSINVNKNAKTDAVEAALKNSGYEVIRVPGRLYETENLRHGTNSLLRHRFNYINANALINDNNELVYITNDSNLDDDFLSDTFDITGISFKNEFLKTISPYVKKEHVYFIKGKDSYVQEEMLWKHFGGIHCACSEIPKDVK